MSERPILERSVNTDRALALQRPRLRGWFHLLAVVFGSPVAVAWIVEVPAGRGRLAVGIFCAGMLVMLSFSATLHLRRWPASTYERLFRLDHTGIYLAICGTAVATSLVGLAGWPARVLLVGALVGSVVGIIVEWMPAAPPRGFNNAVFLSLGWIPVALLPWLWSHSGPGVVVLLIAGGVLYSIGAAVVGLRRPDPWPRWFGYHEIFHVLVLAAVLTHASMLDRLVVR